MGWGREPTDLRRISHAIDRSSLRARLSRRRSGRRGRHRDRDHHRQGAHGRRPERHADDPHQGQPDADGHDAGRQGNRADPRLRRPAHDRHRRQEARSDDHAAGQAPGGPGQDVDRRDQGVGHADRRDQDHRRHVLQGPQRVGRGAVQHGRPRDADGPGDGRPGLPVQGRPRLRRLPAALHDRRRKGLDPRRSARRAGPRRGDGQGHGQLPEDDGRGRHRPRPEHARRAEGRRPDGRHDGPHVQDRQPATSSPRSRPATSTRRCSTCRPATR